ncbi:CpaD family pilus assembly protein [Sphingomonas sp. Y38-1Y]|uniref:CpaD family pilus assembly protein n=1 Tax=Sphingomonas sp. Y38-1Y TaxID=3078265 RepID=UPI0028E57BB3|nr:CpaD family pilus assembly lipoprotein [Sphingomonas sp. Y38-1Y]
MRLSTAAILIAATALTACSGTKNRSLESVHQPVVSRADYALDMGVSGDGLAPGERERLAGWLGALNAGYGDRIAVDDGGNPDPRVREDVAAVAGRQGLLLVEGAPVTPGAVAPGAVRVVVTRMTASVPGCPDHSRTYQPNFGAHTSSDFGCGVNSNIAAMVAHPEDLVRGRTSDGTIDPLTATKPVQALRDKKPAVDQGLQAVRTSQSGAE